MKNISIRVPYLWICEIYKVRNINLEISHFSEFEDVQDVLHTLLNSFFLLTLLSMFIRYFMLDVTVYIDIQNSFTHSSII